MRGPSGQIAARGVGRAALLSPASLCPLVCSLLSGAGAEPRKWRATKAPYTPQLARLRARHPSAMTLTVELIVIAMPSARASAGTLS